MRQYQRQWKLEDLRELSGDTQEQMAHLLNINVSSYRNKEKGDTEFRATEMFKIARYYNRTIEDIFLPVEFTMGEQGEKRA